MKKLIRTYAPDCIIISTLCVISLFLTVEWHAQVKPLTRVFAFVGPAVFTSALMALIAAMSLAARRPQWAWVRRPIIGVAVGSVAITVAMFRAEFFYAPVAWYKKTPPAIVSEQIASNDDVERFQAWSRILTFKEQEKQEVVNQIVEMIVGEDAAAKTSAEFTLDYMLRRYSVRVFQALAPEIQAYLEASVAGGTPSLKSQRAAQFARQFVESRYKSILSALEPKNRGSLPPGGIDALMLVLATHDAVGGLILKGLAEHGDEILKPKAIAVLNLLHAPVSH